MICTALHCFMLTHTIRHTARYPPKVAIRARAVLEREPRRRLARSAAWGGGSWVANRLVVFPETARPVMSGPFFVLFAAFLFAAANAVAKALYLRGHTLVSVFLARCLVVYVVNSWIVACREGLASARRVLLLRTGRRASTQLAALRGLVRALPRFTPQAEGVAQSRRGSQ